MLQVELILQLSVKANRNFNYQIYNIYIATCDIITRVATFKIYINISCISVWQTAQIFIGIKMSAEWRLICRN